MRENLAVFCYYIGAFCVLPFWLLDQHTHSSAAICVCSHKSIYL